MLSVPVFLYLIGKRLRASLKMILLTIMLWFSFPSAFWFGKLIGPELMSIFYGLLGVYLTMRHRKSGLFFLAFSAGIKLNCIVFVFFALFFHFYKKIMKKLLRLET
jgi:hypothetical protein